MALESRQGTSLIRSRNRGRTVFWVYMTIALVFLALEFIGSNIPSQMRKYASDAVLPMLVLLEKPIDAVQGLLERTAGVSDLYLENQSLRGENERLKQWVSVAEQMMRENESLRKMLKVPVQEVPVLATARIVGVGGGAFERSVIINAGARHGLVRNAAVINDNGLVGRVVDTGLLTSRVLLITDLNSRVPVRIGAAAHSAIIEGQNDRLLRLSFIEADYTARAGDRGIYFWSRQHVPGRHPGGRDCRGYRNRDSGGAPDTYRASGFCQNPRFPDYIP